MSKIHRIKQGAHVQTPQGYGMVVEVNCNANGDAVTVRVMDSTGELRWWHHASLLRLDRDPAAPMIQVQVS